jgi:amino acid transporter
VGRLRTKAGRSDRIEWREHLRIFALIANVVMVLTLIAFRMWLFPTVLGVPMIVPPVLAVLALAVRIRH